MAYSITCAPEHNYDDILAIMNLELDFPVADKDNLATTILNIMMGTRQIREGSKPGIDYQYNAKRTIEACIEGNKQIMVYLPSGPKKPHLDGAYVDLAEYWFITILGQIADKISAIYAPGIRFNIIAEDASMELFEPEIPLKAATAYITKFNNLVRVLGYSNSVVVIPESKFVTAQALLETGYEIRNTMTSYLTMAYASVMKSDIDSMSKYMTKLNELGWQGDITRETLDYYYYNFSNNYPGKSRNELIEAISLYLSTSYARYKLGVRPDGIIASNAKRVPGVIWGKHNRIYYRTVPLCKTKTNIPFWRARGVIAIENGEYITKLFPYNQTPEVEVNRVVVTNSNGDSARLHIDILI